MTFHRATTIDSEILAMRDSVARHELFLCHAWSFHDHSITVLR